MNNKRGLYKVIILIILVLFILVVEKNVMFAEGVTCRTSSDCVSGTCEDYVSGRCESSSRVKIWTDNTPFEWYRNTSTVGFSGTWMFNPSSDGTEITCSRSSHEGRVGILPYTGEDVVVENHPGDSIEPYRTILYSDRWANYRCERKGFGCISNCGEWKFVESANPWSDKNIWGNVCTGRPSNSCSSYDSSCYWVSETLGTCLEEEINATVDITYPINEETYNLDVVEEFRFISQSTSNPVPCEYSFNTGNTFTSINNVNPGVEKIVFINPVLGENELTVRCGSGTGINNETIIFYVAIDEAPTITINYPSNSEEICAPWSYYRARIIDDKDSFIGCDYVIEDSSGMPITYSGDTRFFTNNTARDVFLNEDISATEYSLPQSNLRFVLTCIDSSDNSANITIMGIDVIDCGIVPNVTISYPVNNEVYDEGVVQSFVFSATDPTGLTSCHYNLNGAGWNSISISSGTYNTGSISTIINPVSAQENSLIVRCTNNLDNNGSASVNFVVNEEVSPPTTPDLSNCFIDNKDNTYENFTIVGYVSTQGHYSELLLSGFPYGLFCTKFLLPQREDVATTFYFAEPSGHISLKNDPMYVNFTGEAILGFTNESCQIRNTECEAQEICVLRVNNEDQSHVISCDGFMPPGVDHDNNIRICCELKEYCRDGIDNTGDGLIDCASPDCHQSPVNMEPRRCDPDTNISIGNKQNTTQCVLNYNETDDSTIYKTSCLGPSFDIDTETGWASITPWPLSFPHDFIYPDVKQPYYCSYGVNDDGLQTNNTGYCCPPDTRAEQHPFTGDWSCQPFEECGTQIGLPCNKDYRENITYFQEWINSIYDTSDPINWCVSKVFDYYNPIESGFLQTSSSMSCCFVKMYGKFGFYHKDGNVKIFGYEN